MNKLLAVFGVLFCVSAVLASDYFETGRPIVSLYASGGFVPETFNLNAVPEVKLWEDGTIIFSSTDAQGKRQVLFTTVAKDEITHLNDKIQASGFMGFQSQYTGANAPTDLPSTCIKFWSTETSSKQVCDYFNGAPDFFQYLATRLRALKDSVKAKARPFYPVAGFVKAFPEQCGTACPKTARSYNGISITTQGVWVTDLRTLATLWDAANNNEVLTDCPTNYFRVTVQVEDLSVVEPPARIEQPRPLPTPNTTQVYIRIAAFGLSGLMFILGLALLIRIIRRRREQREAMENDAEVPMVETPSHSAATSTSVYEQPAAPQFVATQWAGQPAYVNTTPQYMVYYMQPTQTQQ